MPGLSGVGIDLEELGGLDRFDRPAIARATARLLSPRERDWCARQPSAAQALVIVLCCREAAFKCGGARLPAHELVLRMEGGGSAGRAEWADPGSVEIKLAWRIVERRVLALAAAGPPGTPAGILRRLLGHEHESPHQDSLLHTTLTPGAPCPRSS